MRTQCVLKVEFIERNPGDKVSRSCYTLTNRWAISALCCLPHVQICSISFHELFYCLCHIYLILFIIFYHFYWNSCNVGCIFSQPWPAAPQQTWDQPTAVTLHKQTLTKFWPITRCSPDCVLKTSCVTSPSGKSRKIHNFCNVPTRMELLTEKFLGDLLVLK